VSFPILDKIHGVSFSHLNRHFKVLKRHLPRHCLCAVISVEMTLQFWLCMDDSMRSLFLNFYNPDVYLLKNFALKSENHYNHNANISHIYLKSCHFLNYKDDILTSYIILHSFENAVTGNTIKIQQIIKESIIFLCL
jgi:hypothetical protein